MSDPTPTIPTSTVEYYQPLPVYLAPPRRQRYWLHALLLLATTFTTLVVGSRMQASFNAGHSAFSFADDDSLLSPYTKIWEHPSRLLLGIPFSASLMLILLAHEMGHYLYCVHYGVSATLPSFIPLPILSPIGTLGAFIRIRSPIRSRTALFDIGIAGPIAGFVVACTVLVFALGMSHAAPSEVLAGEPNLQMNYPWIFALVHRLCIALGMAHDAASLPLGQVYLHPVAIAAWFGMFATSLNLLPGGQLDGGHILFSIAPRAHRFVSRLTIFCLVPMGVYWWFGWLIWAVLLELSSLRHPQVADYPKVEGVRIWLAAFALLMLALTLVPAPFTGYSLREVAPPALHAIRDLLAELAHRAFR